MKISCVLSLLIFTMSCQNSTVKKDNTNQSFGEKLETAHNKPKFDVEKAINFDLQLFFGGKERLNANVTIYHNSYYAILKYKNGDEVRCKGMDIYYSPGMDTSGLKFSAFTWTYFFMLPYKAQEKGTKLNDYSNKMLNGKTFEVEKLSFGKNIGDSPEDWYILYANAKTHLLEYAAYIVTAGGRNIEEAEQSAHAVSYEDYKEVKGVPISREWKFWNWTKDNGLGEQLGYAHVTNVKFKNMNSDDFKIPENLIKLD